MRRRRPETLVLLLAVALPLFSYPLSWFPQFAAQFRFSIRLPLAVMALVGWLVAMAWRLLAGATRAARDGETNRADPVAHPLPWSLIGPAILLGASWWLSVRFSDDPHVSIGSLPIALANLAVFFVAACFPEVSVANLLWAWLAAAVLVATNGLLRLGTELEFISTIGNWNFLAAYLAAGLVFAVALRDKRAWICGVPLLLALVACRSRGAWLALGGTTVLAFLLAPDSTAADSRPAEIGSDPGPRTGDAPTVAEPVPSAGRVLPRRWPGWRLRGAILLVLAALSAILARGYVVRQWRTEVRPVIWRSTLRLIAARPILGHGLGTFVVQYPHYRLPEYFSRAKAGNVTDHAHNELLEIAAEQGLLGAGAIVWLWSVALARGLRWVRGGESPRGLRFGLWCAAVVLLLHGMVDVDLRYAPNQTLLWLLLGLLAGRGPAAAGAAAGRWNDWRRSHWLRVLGAIAGLVAAAWIGWYAVLDPIRADWWEREGRLAEAQGNFGPAAAAAQRALELQPFRLSTRYFLAGILAQSSQATGRKLAIEECLRIEELAPDYAEVTFNLGRLYLMDGRPGDAVPYLERAARADPANAEKRAILALAVSERNRRAAPTPR